MKRIIKIDRDKIYLTPGFALTWEDTNLPFQAFKIKSARTYLWEVHITNYERDQGILHFEVIDYDSPEELAFSNQKMKGKISGIHFLPLNKEYFLNMCSYYALRDITPFLSIEPLESGGFEIESKEILKPYISQSIFQDSTEREIFFSYPFNQALFGHGYLECTTWVPEINELISVRIYNRNLIPEFYLIRNFFHRVFQTRKFHVKAIIRFELGKVIEINAKSKEIDSINGRILERIRTAPFHHLIQSHRPEKTILVSPEDLLKEYEEMAKDKDSKTIQNEDIFSIWMSHSGVRNRHQLVYLAGKIQQSSSKIRITVKPDFGFLFHHSTEGYHHWIWELLNSNATYVWSFSQETHSKQRCLQKLEESIQYIGDLGRIRYKSWTKQDPHKDYGFHAIHHTGQTNIEQDPFVRWKENLHKVLI